MSTVITASVSNFAITKGKTAKAHKALLSVIRHAEPGTELSETIKFFNDRDASRLADAFLMCGWRAEFDDEGAVTELYYNNWKFAWDEDTAVLGAIAPFVKKGSKLTLTTEYGERFVYSFDGRDVTFEEK